jgi:cupin 2 domain-containing protein
MKQNIASGIPNTIPNEIFEPLLNGNQFRMERIVSSGHASPKDFWYDQVENEWVLLIQGSATLEIELPSKNGTPAIQQVNLVPGDYLLIPKHQRHRVAATAPNVETIWLAIHFES